MTVKELMATLSTLDQDAVVIMQKDPEGNGYSPCSGIGGNGAWNKSDHEYGYATLTANLEKSGFTKEDIVNGVPAVVMWPEY